MTPGATGAQTFVPPTETGAPEHPLKLLVFGFDAAEAAQIRRMRSYLDCGFDVTGYMKRRANMNADFVPFWDNVHLYNTANESPARRAAAVAGSVGKLLAHRDKLAGTDVIVARNLDMLAIAAAAQAMLRPRPPLIYECLDIHDLMSSSGVKCAALRRGERLILARCASLIVSSPAFVREYFAPVQGGTGPVTLLENKLRLGDTDPTRPDPAPPATEMPETWTAERPLVLGWVGTLRCAPSLALLAAGADRLGPRVRVALHGIVHSHAVPDFDRIVAARDNMTWYGAYNYPGDLAEIYSDCDLVWSQDLWQWGTNSTWLLPNRFYEACYYGCPSRAVAGSETGVRVAAGLGWTIPAPEAAALADLLDRLSPADVAACRRALLSRPETDFRQTREEVAAAIRLPLGTVPVT